jgi:hypothetical protein
MTPQRQTIAANDQLALFCSQCGRLLLTATEQATQCCQACQAAPDPALTTTSCLSTKRTNRHLSHAETREQELDPPRPRRRRRPSWVYESARDDLRALFAIYTTVFNQPPVEEQLLDDPHTLREMQHLYAMVVDQYFDADAPYGVNRSGVLRWLEERCHQQPQQR